MLQRILLGLVVTFGLVSCGGESSNGDENVHKNGRLISGELREEFSNTDINLPNIDAKYSVKVYRIVYETKNIDGNFIKASGLLSIPNKPPAQKSPFLLYHHGTIFENKFAPTENIRKGESPVLPAYLGFISLAPDYIGYGESKDYSHPYVNIEVTATTSIDLLRASKVFLKKKNILSNGQLFLAGYSQGGSATLATQKKIEGELADEFTITASSAGAGSYAISHEVLTASQAILEDFEAYIINRPSTIGLTMKSIDEANGLGIINKLFQPKYATIINKAYDGRQSAEVIDSQLTTQAKLLFNKEFIQRFVNGEEPALLNAFKANDLLDWNPKSPTRLYHGQDDDVVAFNHSQTAYNEMISRGVTNLELTECIVDAGTVTNHANCFTPYLFSSYEFFLRYATDL